MKFKYQAALQKLEKDPNNVFIQSYAFILFSPIRYYYIFLINEGFSLISPLPKGHTFQALQNLDQVCLPWVGTCYTNTCRKQVSTNIRHLEMSFPKGDKL